MPRPLTSWLAGFVSFGKLGRTSLRLVKTAIEAPLIAGEITLGVLRVERATSADNRALDFAETRVCPLEALRRPDRAPSYRTRQSAGLDGCAWPDCGTALHSRRPLFFGA